MKIIKILLGCCFLALPMLVLGQTMPWKQIGKVKTRKATEISSSRWSIGGETLDRGYANYNSYKSYLGPLGAKRIRLQAGWARCEKVKGQYDFNWLDSVVNDAIAQGVQPWLQLSYGNPIYLGGGDAALAGGLPTSEEALAAWDKWAYTLINHFKNRIHEWEIWNEPDLSHKFTAQDYARFYQRTATIVRQEQPKARLIGLVLCCSGWAEYAQALVNQLKATDNLKLIDIVTFHGYQLIPEKTYVQFEQLRDVVLTGNSKAEFWQGENGAPSVKKGESVGAMNDHDWSELTQGKWDLRRMLGDMGHDVAVTNIFQISDMYYSNTDHFGGYNAKGLLRANPDKTIAGPKQAYFAYQNAATVLSGRLERIKEKTFGLPPEISAYAYRNTGNKGNYVTLWKSDAIPSDSTSYQKVDLNISNVTIRNPVYVDLLNGNVYEIPKSRIRVTATGMQIMDVPVPDYPVVIAEKLLIGKQ